MTTSTPTPTKPPEPSRHDVWKMFDRISPSYDRLNRILSLGIDRGWRRRMASLLPAGESLKILDLATGTADQILSLCRECPRVQSGIGMDLAEQMLEIGRIKVEHEGMSSCVQLKNGDACKIPLGDNEVDAVTISFGIRNVLSVETALREMLRVLKPGGRVLLLECTVPRNPVVKAGHLFYMRTVLPTVGGWFSGDREAYRYLNETIETFPSGAAFCAMMNEAGFVQVKHTPLTLGVSTIYQGDKP